MPPPLLLSVSGKLLDSLCLGFSLLFLKEKKQKNFLYVLLGFKVKCLRSRNVCAHTELGCLERKEAKELPVRIA